jgi:hypothetical protein
MYFIAVALALLGALAGTGLSKFFHKPRHFMLR